MFIYYKIGRLVNLKYKLSYFWPRAFKHILAAYFGSMKSFILPTKKEGKNFLFK